MAAADQLRVPVMSRCYRCQADVIDGPEGGYACGGCGHTVEPPARAAARRQATGSRKRTA